MGQANETVNQDKFVYPPTYGINSAFRDELTIVEQRHVRRETLFDRAATRAQSRTQLLMESFQRLKVTLLAGAEHERFGLLISPVAERLIKSQLERWRDRKSVV